MREDEYFHHRILADRLRANFHSHAQSLLSLLAGGDLAWGKCGRFWQIITADLSLTKTGWIMPSLPPDLLQNDMPVSKNFLIFDHMASSDANLVEQRTVNLWNLRKGQRTKRRNRILVNLISKIWDTSNWKTEKLTVRLDWTLIFPKFRQARPDFFREWTTEEEKTLPILPRQKVTRYNKK